MALSISVRCTLFVIAILFAGIFASCLPVRERLAARAERSGGDYRAECGIFTSIAFAEYLYHSHTIQETTLPIPVFAPEDGCLLYLFWELLQSGKI